MVVLALAVSAKYAAIVLLAITTAFYLIITANRVFLFARSRRAEFTEHVTDEEARRFPDEDLPPFTVLVPAYREPEVISLLLTNLGRLDYPASKLDIKICLEADDQETLAAVADVDPGSHFEVVVVPPAGPRTKPKALNYALPCSRGSIVTIYDAEDEPDPLQLRRAAIALSRLPEEVVCLQAKLSFANVEQNLLTKWFTLEYDMWFTMLLPGLVSVGAPLPLGGTSNHFRRKQLEELGGWDPFNVTEDADLGVRLARMGYRCSVLESTTLEEANSDFINWVKQRSRWYKGYLQTALIHLRRPREVYHQLGWRGFTELILFVFGTPMLAVLNPLFWFLTALWFGGHPHFIKELFPAAVYYPAVASWVFGNFLVLYITLMTCRITRRPELIISAILVPIYWVIMAAAATKAFWQLIVTPTFWEKTVHGLGGGGGRADANPSPSPSPTSVPAPTGAG